VLERPSPNFNERKNGAPIDMLVLHYTGMKTGEKALERLCDASAEVSAHYLIDERGGVTRLVEEKKRAWHAGVASWRGNTDINCRSIGIELVNPGHEFGYREFTDIQMSSLEILALDILRRYPIPARNVVGHSDIAPQRKKDPGELLDWASLARSGIGLYPPRCKPRVPHATTVREQLNRIGYEIETSGVIDNEARKVIKAFQRHFRPQRVDGLLDSETAGRIATVAQMMEN
jgi:N-acetylmuramoyl-L-alanine amidase